VIYCKTAYLIRWFYCKNKYGFWRKGTTWWNLTVIDSNPNPKIEPPNPKNTNQNPKKFKRTTK
jgi:hypothetical protein